MNKLKVYLKRKLRVLMGALLVSAVLCTPACGGGSSKEDVPRKPVEEKPDDQTIRSYWMTFGSYFKGTLANAETGEVWATWEASYGDPKWGDTIERFVIVTCADGKEWKMLRSFDDMKANASYALSDHRTEVRRNGGPWENVSDICPIDGVIYMPAEVPPNGTLEVRQWAWVHSGPPGSAAFAHKRPFYWQAHFTYGQYEYNPCWSQGAESRKAIVQSEIWWDGNGGWARGIGSATPWQNDEPVEIVPTHTPHRITIAQGAGVGWTITEPKPDFSGVNHLCLKESEARP